MDSETLHHDQTSPASGDASAHSQGQSHCIATPHEVLTESIDISDLSNLDAEQCNLSTASTQLADRPKSKGSALHMEDSLYRCTAGSDSETDLPGGSQVSRVNDVDHQKSMEDINLVRVRTQVQKKWTSNPRKGIQITTKYFYEEIDTSWTVVLLAACYFPAGIIDAVAFQCWSTFVSMQTGNTVLAAIRISNNTDHGHPYGYVKNLVSIVCYCLGCLGFNILHRLPHGLQEPRQPLHRRTLFMAFGIQSALLACAAILATTGQLSVDTYEIATITHNTRSVWVNLVAIAVLAFEAAGQVWLSRVLAPSDLTTIAISLPYHNFIVEMMSVRKVWRESKTKRAFIVSQKKQALRVVSVIGVFVGAIIGGIANRRGGMPAALWTAAGTKICICLAWCLWKKKTVAVTEVTTEKATASAPAQPATAT